MKQMKIIVQLLINLIIRQMKIDSWLKWVLNQSLLIVEILEKPR